MYLDKESLQVPWIAMAGNHDHDGNVDAQIEFGLTEPLWYFPSLYYTFTTVTILIESESIKCIPPKPISAKCV